MKVELNNIRLAITAQGTPVVGIVEKDGKSMKDKKVVTDDFVKSVLDWLNGRDIFVTNPETGLTMRVSATPHDMKLHETPPVIPIK